jgi:hypothetical protein
MLIATARLSLGAVSEAAKAKMSSAAKLADVR